VNYFQVGGYPPATKEAPSQWIENLSMSGLAIRRESNPLQGAIANFSIPLDDQVVYV
jgi:hypothetical protein